MIARVDARAPVARVLGTGSRTVENLSVHEIIDAVVGAGEVGEVAARALDALCALRRRAQRGRPGDAPAVSGHPRSVSTHVPAWQSIERSRRDDRVRCARGAPAGRSGRDPVRHGMRLAEAVESELSDLLAMDESGRPAARGHRALDRR